MKALRGKLQEDMREKSMDRPKPKPLDQLTQKLKSQVRFEGNRDTPGMSANKAHYRSGSNPLPSRSVLPPGTPPG